MTIFPKEGKRLLGKAGKATKGKGQPKKPPLLKIEGGQSYHCKVFSEFRLTLLNGCFDGGSHFWMQEKKRDHRILEKGIVTRSQSLKQMNWIDSFLFFFFP